MQLELRQILKKSLPWQGMTSEDKMIKFTPTPTTHQLSDLEQVS